MSNPYISGGCRPASQICLLAQWYANSAALPNTMPDKVAATWNNTRSLTGCLSRPLQPLRHQTF